ncbi:MAG TPA: choice-of-anchor D domain-containing protein [Kofleriaceae bacterium]|nr:choice-of-anchor D domain-containing protein [Kofleriaceae bacterium]
MGTATGTISDTVGDDLDLVFTCPGFDISPKTDVLVTVAMPATITGSYIPSARGAASCTVSMNDHTSGMTLGTFTMTATGVAPVVSVSPASKDFGIVRAAETALVHTATQVFTVSNTTTDSGEDLVVSAINFVGGQNADYAITAGPSFPATITPGNQAQWTVTFDPNAVGPSSTTMSIASNDPIDPTDDVALQGQGGDATISVTDVAYGTVAVGGSLTKNITVSNTGAAPQGLLGVTSATISGGSGFFTFTGTGCAGSTSCTFSPALSIGAPAAVGVKCAPIAGVSGTQTAMVTFTSDADDTSDSVATLTCTAGPAISGPASLAFGAIEVGKNGSQILTVTNIGGSTLTISNAALTSGTSDYLVTSGTTGTQITTIAPNGTDSWTIECAPSTFGSRPGNFQVTSDATNTPTLNVPLSCTGDAGQLTITPATYNFGGVRIGDTSSQTFTLKNAGNLAVSNVTAAFTTANIGYTITSPTFPISSIAAGGTVTVTVQFAPQVATDGGPDNLNFSGTWGSSSTTTMATLALDGTALVAGFDTNPHALAFGDVRFDQSSTLPLQIINTATDSTTTVKIESLAITPGLNTTTGQFTVTTCTHSGTPVVCPTVTSPFTLTGMNDTLVVNVKCAPGATAMGALAATLTIHSDLGTNPDRVVPLSATSTSAALTVSPVTDILDFGAVDLDGGPVMETITLTNTGVASLDIGAATKGGANLARFAFGPLGAQTIPMNGSFSVTVTYTPNTERPPGQDDIATLTWPLSGIQGGPSSLTVTIEGRGIDRHIQVAPAPMFPDTYRNPGDKAPTLPVMISNTGEAVLSITAVMLSGEPVWTVQNPQPVDVPGSSTFQFMVTFAPTAAGKAPDGQLVLMNNDNGDPMATITLQGNGIDRRVTMGPGVIDLGYTGIGIPVKLSTIAPTELLAVTNTDTNTFDIRTIDIDGDGEFAIAGTDGSAPAGISLPPGMTDDFDITFTPTSEGDFEATASLFLDMDPDAQATVDVRGHAVYVDAKGGGGCAAGGGAGGMVLAIGGLALALRRRRAGLALVALIGAFGASGARARADSPRNLDLTVFDPTPATTGQGFQLQDASTGASGAYVVTALASYAADPLVLDTVQNDDAAVRSRTMLELGGAYAFGDRFEAGVRMPLYIQTGQTVDSSMMFGVPPATGAARGDLVLHGKMRLLRGDAGGALTAGLGLALELPTASSGEFAGTDEPAGEALALVSWNPDALDRRLTLTANAGGVLRSKVRFANVEQGSGVAWAVGGQVRVLDTLWADGELFGEVVPSGRIGEMGGSSAMTTVEGLVGIRYQMERRLGVGLGVGRGVTTGIGSPDVRGVVSFIIAPSAAPVAPIHGVAPDDDRDSDGDGIPDRLDKCPNEPEDKDMFEDQDGCPDPDNDHDGIPDDKDKCPLDPEDKDGFQDEDGCPDPDNDGDGIPDTMDKCPNDPEDKDGFQDLDGCPDPDNDGDGIPDVKDKCPNEPETINGFQDEDGCPDKGDPSVAMSPDRIELLDAIQFTGGSKIAKASFNLLGQVAATMRAHPEIVRLRVTSHVQPTRDPDRDQALTDKRAAAIRDWLVQWGIAPARLEARGFGGERPLVPPDQKGAAAINDRIELIILERK